MKKQLLFLLFSFFSLKINTYQPAEKIFPSIVAVNQIKKTNVFVNNRNRVSKGIPVLDKRSDGKDSNVLIISSLLQFLTVCRENKPIILKLFAQTGLSKESYQSVADKLNKDACFLSINIVPNLQMVKMFLLLLKMKGLVFAQNVNKFPMILMCKPDFAVFTRGSVSFNKEGLTLISYGLNQSEDILADTIKKVLKNIKNLAYNSKSSHRTKLNDDERRLSRWDKFKISLKKLFSKNK